MPATELITKIKEFHTTHQDGTVFIDEKISYRLKDIIRRARKNYLGVYDEPLDPVTKQEKYWPPLTETFCDGVIKSIDIDTKDIDLYTTNGINIGSVNLLKLILKQKLSESNFGQAINDFLRYLVVDGTGNLKFSDYYDKKKKKKMMRFTAVDNLNITADPSAECLLDSFGILERALYTQDELRKMEGTWDKDKIKLVIAGMKNDSFTRYALSGSTIAATAPYYAIYDYWGQMDKEWITGKEKDKGIWVEGHAVISNIADEGPAEILFIEEPKGDRPYVDVPLKKVIGRRIGRGVPEQLFGTQKYMNMLIEIRKKNAQILQNGLFTLVRGHGNTADSILSKISAGGIIQVNNQGDFQQLPLQDSRTANYTDEDRLMMWGERETGQFDVRRGEALSASAPATTQLIQDRNSRDLYQLVQENIGLALSSFFEGVVIPWIIENTSNDEIVLITGDVQELQELDNAMAETLVMKEVDKFIEKHQQFPTPEDVLSLKEKQLAVFRSMGKRRYTQIRKSLFEDLSVAVNVPITNETVDKNLIVSKLQEILTLAVTNPGVMGLDPKGILYTVFDTLGVPVDRILTDKKVYGTPNDKSLAQRKVAAAAASQQMNALSGAQAPQMNIAEEPSLSPNQNLSTLKTKENETMLS